MLSFSVSQVIRSIHGGEMVKARRKGRRSIIFPASGGSKVLISNSSRKFFHDRDGVTAVVPFVPSSPFFPFHFLFSLLSGRKDSALFRIWPVFH